MNSPSVSLWFALPLLVQLALHAPPAPSATLPDPVPPAVAPGAPPPAPAADGTEAPPPEGTLDAPPAPAEARRAPTPVVSLGGDVTVPAGEIRPEAVSLGGDIVVDGEVTGAAVSLGGDITVNGRVGHEVVSLLGSTSINGRVKGSAVALLGDLQLGPEAVVDQEVVAVLGTVRRAPGAQVGAGVTEVGGDFLAGGAFRGIRAYLRECVLWGRPLAFGRDLGWAWAVAALFLVLYALLALLLPRGIDRCAEALETKPGGTLLAALLAVLMAPLVLVLLALTGIGLLLVPFLLAAAALFGKAAVLAWFGRRVTAPFAARVRPPAFLSVLLGGIVVALLYCLPFLGVLLWHLFGVLGLGMVVYVLASTMRRERAAPAAGAPNPFVAAAAPGAPFASEPPPAGPAFTPTFGAPPPAAAQPFAATATAIPSAATLPRAGFWIRTAAALLDFIMITVVLGVLDLLDNGPGLLFVGLAAYCAAMWKVKGTTVGGVICGLKVVRLDDRPLDWGVAVVRALSAFLSLCAAGLGFIWVAFDEERQSWHDKIAGTTIVRVPRGTPLL